MLEILGIYNIQILYIEVVTPYVIIKNFSECLGHSGGPMAFVPPFVRRSSVDLSAQTPQFWRHPLPGPALVFR